MNQMLPAVDKPLEPSAPDGTTIKLIGLGGVGSIVARYSALFLASCGGECRLVLIDGDSFDPSNAARMMFGQCGNKAVVVCAELMPAFVDTGLSVLAVPEYVTRENLPRLVVDGDIVLLAVDNHATRKLVSDYCATLSDVCLISGGNDGIGLDGSGTFRRGTYGNVQVYIRAHGRDTTPPLTHMHPEIEHPRDRHPNDMSCIDMILSMPQILFTNLATASAMLNTLWLHLCSALHYHELAFDIADGLMRPVMPIQMPGGETRSATPKVLTTSAHEPAGNETERDCTRVVSAGRRGKKRGPKSKSR